MHTFAGIRFEDLETMSPDAINALPYGVIGIQPDTTVTLYNRTEEQLAGLPAETVIGQPYFTNVAQCMNNYLIAQRFEDEPDLDVLMDYVLTLRMRPTPVQIRLLKRAGAPVQYVLVQR